MTYIVTTEIKTVWWMKILRFIRVKPKLQTFDLYFRGDPFSKKDILTVGDNSKILVISRKTN